MKKHSIFSLLLLFIPCLTSCNSSSLSKKDARLLCNEIINHQNNPSFIPPKKVQIDYYYELVDPTFLMSVNEITKRSQKIIFDRDSAFYYEKTTTETTKGTVVISQLYENWIYIKSGFIYNVLHQDITFGTETKTYTKTEYISESNNTFSLLQDKVNINTLGINEMRYLLGYDIDEIHKYGYIDDEYVSNKRKIQLFSSSDSSFIADINLRLDTSNITFNCDFDNNTLLSSFHFDIEFKYYFKEKRTMKYLFVEYDYPSLNDYNEV